MRASPLPPIPPGVIITELKNRPRLPWLARVRDSAHRRYINESHASYESALKWARAKQSELNLGLIDTGKFTLTSLRVDYINELKRLNLTPHYIADVDRTLVDAIANGCNDILGEHFRARVRDWLDPSDGRSPRTRNKRLSMLHSAILFAVAEGRMRFDPLRNFSTETDPSQGKIRNVYNPTELALMVADHNDHHDYYPEACALVYLGLRVTEAANLQWSWFDFPGAVVNIRQDPDTGFAPKRYEERTIPLMREAFDLFHDLAPRRARAGQYLSRRQSRAPNQASRKALEYLDHLEKDKAHPFEIRGRDAHSIRHTWVSLRLALGVPSLVVKLQVGHQQVTTTEKYTHAIPHGWIKDWPITTPGEFRLRPAITDRPTTSPISAPSSAAAPDSSNSSPAPTHPHPR